MNILEHKNSELLIFADASDKKAYVMPPNNFKAIITTKKKSIRNADEY